jgi:hypothetical protein
MYANEMLDESKKKNQHRTRDPSASICTFVPAAATSVFVLLYLDESARNVSIRLAIREEQGALHNGAKSRSKVREVVLSCLEACCLRAISAKKKNAISVRDLKGARRH